MLNAKPFKFLPVRDIIAHGDFLTFEDANMGQVACIRNWYNDGPWLFTELAHGYWLSLRRANDKDCAALGVPEWMRADAEPSC